MSEVIRESDFLFYHGEDGKTHAQVILGAETVWLSQKTMGEVFGVDRSVITKHLINIFSEGELLENRVCAIFAQTATDGKTYDVKFYNLDAIIAVGYRVNSYQATKFRQWATKILNEYLIKGFVLDDERLKQGNRLFGKDYFKELLERIREIRTSERMFYEKIKDLYKTSIDYDKDSPRTRDFFATVQNKLEYAIVGKTSAEIIKSRANANMPNMGLKTYKNIKRDGHINAGDITVAKNYLTEDELSKLRLLVNMFLDYAESIVLKGDKLMKMSDWAKRLDAFLQFNEYQILNNPGKVSAKMAQAFAEKEYKKFKENQNKLALLEAKKTFDSIILSGELPKEPILSNPEPLTEFNKKLKKALEYTATPKPQRGRKKITTKVCPNCGKVNDIDAEYCEGDIEVDGDIKPCGWTFDK